MSTQKTRPCFRRMSGHWKTPTYLSRSINIYIYRLKYFQLTAVNEWLLLVCKSYFEEQLPWWMQHSSSPNQISLLLSFPEVQRDTSKFRNYQNPEKESWGNFFRAIIEKGIYMLKNWQRCEREGERQIQNTGHRPLSYQYRKYRKHF